MQLPSAGLELRQMCTEDIRKLHNFYNESFVYLFDD